MKILNFLLSLVGYKQAWHTSWVVFVPGQAPFYADTALTVSPRLTGEAVDGLRKRLAVLSTKSVGRTVESSQIIIISLTRIGS